MVYNNNLLRKDSQLTKKRLKLLSKKWKISDKVYDLHLGKRDDLDDTIVNIDGVKFHIPTLTRDGLFVLWRCLWPDCVNCCNYANFIPLTKNDIETLSKKMGYYSKSDFIKKETIISSWVQKEAYGKFDSIRTNISLKRRRNEKENDEGKTMKCRFLNSCGCRIHSFKPGVCQMYPFVSYLENDAEGRSVIHAEFQFTGDCPGFYVENTLEHIMPTLKECSKIIYDYTMAYLKTMRENYSVTSILRASL